MIAPHNQVIWSELPKVFFRIQRRQYFRIEVLLGTEITFHIPEAAVRRIELPSLHNGRTLCAIEFLEISKDTRDHLISHIFRQQRVVTQKLGR